MDVMQCNTEKHAVAQKLYSDDTRIKLPKLNPTQVEFVRARDPFVCLSGGFGSGKTTAGVWRSIMLSIDSPYFGDLSGNVGLMGRFKLSDFEKTTLPELLRWIPSQWIRRVYKKDGLIALVNESIIQFTHFEDMEHLQSFNIGWCFFDQMEQIPWDVFKAVAYERIRLTTLNKFRYDSHGRKFPVNPPVSLNYQTVFGACNPKRCWIHDKFVKNDEYLRSPEPSIRKLHNPNFRLISSSTYENARNLPAGYIERQKQDKSKRDFERSVNGSWDVFEGQIYDDFSDALVNPENHVPRPEWSVYVGIDHGGTGAPGASNAFNVTYVEFAALEERAGDNPIVHVYDELFLPSSTIEETVAAIDRKLMAHRTASMLAYPQWYSEMSIPEISIGMYDNDRVVPLVWRCDPSMQKRNGENPETIMEAYMRHASNRGFNMPLCAGNNDVASGIQRCAWMFRRGLVRVNPRCKWFIETHKSYSYGKNEEPAKNQNDHPTDTHRYLCSALPLWYANFQLPEHHESAVMQDMMRRMAQHNNDAYDSVYGNNYSVMGI